MSSSMTLKPPWAAVWAMPDPIVPAPITAMVFISIVMSCLLQGKMGDQEPEHVRGAFAYGQQPRVSPVPVDIGAVDIAVAAVDLQGLVADHQRGLRRKELGL